jgi:hypothetical protein
MHKDKPPGLFDFAERGIRYLVGFWFTTGLVLSILVRTAMLVLRDDASNHTVRSSDAIEAAANARKPPKDPNASAPSPAAVRY